MEEKEETEFQDIPQVHIQGSYCSSADLDEKMKNTPCVSLINGVTMMYMLCGGLMVFLCVSMMNHILCKKEQ